jgi:hypothetical protein
VVIDSGASVIIRGLKIPCGPSNGTRSPSSTKPSASTDRGSTSPMTSICARSH